MTEDLISRIKRHEGFRGTAYIDTTGNATIGYGHKILPSEDFTSDISEAEATDILNDDLSKIITQANRVFPWLLGMDDARRDAVYEMCYQLGVAGVIRFPKMIAAIRDKDYNAASHEMLNSEWNRQTPDRCAELANIMLTGGTDD